MNVKRRLLLVLICCMVVFTSTGCGMMDNISETVTGMLNKHTSNSINSKCNNVTAVGCNEDTQVQIVKLQEASDKLVNQDSGLAFWRWGEDNYCPPLKFFEERQNEKLNKNVENETVALDRALASDEAYQKNKSGKNSKILKIVGIAVLAVIVLLILMLLLKRKRRHKAAPVPVAAPAPVAASHSGLLNAGDTTRNNLQNLCSANGIDYNRVVAKFGDDERGLTRAYTKLSAKVRAGDMEGVEELLS